MLKMETLSKCYSREIFTINLFIIALQQEFDIQQIEVEIYFQGTNRMKTKRKPNTKSINIYVVVERKFQNHRICLKNDKHAKCSEFKTVRKAINYQFKTITFSLQYKPAKFSGTLIPVDAQLKTDQ